MIIPFPFDLIAYWTEKHNVQLSNEARDELAELFRTYSEKPNVSRLKIREDSHMADALMYSLHARGIKKLPTYKIWYYRLKRIMRRFITNVTKEL